MGDNGRRGIEELRQRQEARASSGSRDQRPAERNARRKGNRIIIVCLVLMAAVAIGWAVVLKNLPLIQKSLEIKPSEYMPFDLVAMADAVDQNPLRAKELYNNQYGQVHGYVDYIGEADGKAAFIITSRKYETVSAEDMVNPFSGDPYSGGSFPTDVPGHGSTEYEIGETVGRLTCVVTDDQQREVLLTLSIGDAVTVCGRVVYAQGMYAMEVDSISRAEPVEESAGQSDSTATPDPSISFWQQDQQIAGGQSEEP